MYISNTRSSQHYVVLWNARVYMYGILYMCAFIYIHMYIKWNNVDLDFIWSIAALGSPQNERLLI